MIFGFRSSSTTFTPIAIKNATVRRPVAYLAAGLFDANGTEHLSIDNSLPENFLEHAGITAKQHEHFKTAITKYRQEIDEIADPKTAYSITENSLLKMEMNAFETVGAEIEQDLREELLQQLTEDQLVAIRQNINLVEAVLLFWPAQHPNGIWSGRYRQRFI